MYGRALQEEGERLLQTDVLVEADYIFFLTFQELHDATSRRGTHDPG